MTLPLPVKQLNDNLNLAADSSTCIQALEEHGCYGKGALVEMCCSGAVQQLRRMPHELNPLEVTKKFRACEFC